NKLNRQLYGVVLYRNMQVNMQFAILNLVSLRWGTPRWTGRPQADHAAARRLPRRASGTGAASTRRSRPSGSGAQPCDALRFPDADVTLHVGGPPGPRERRLRGRPG